MGRLQEPQPAVLHEGDAPPAQLDLQQVAVVGAAEQHGLLAQRHSRLVVLEDDVGDRLGLGPSSGQVASTGRAPPACVGPQPLGVALGGVGQHGVGQVEDGLGRAVVLLQATITSAPGK